MNIKLYSGVSKDMRRRTFKRTMLYVATGVLFILGVTGAVNIINTNSVQAEASAIEWMGDNKEAAVTAVIDDHRGTDTSESSANHSQKCVERQIWVGSSDKPDTACVYQAKSFRLARVYRCVPSGPGMCYREEWMAFGFDGESKMHKINDLPVGSSDACWQLVAASDRVVQSCNGYTLIIDDFTSHLTKSVEFGNSEYNFNEPSEYLLKDSSGVIVRTGAVSMSVNGEWLVGEASDHGLFRMNLEDRSMRMFEQYDQSGYGYGRDPSFEFVISGDGAYVVAVGRNVGAAIYHIDNECGEDSSLFKVEWLQQRPKRPMGCLRRNLADPLQSAYDVSVNFSTANYPRFSDDNSQLEIFVTFTYAVSGEYISNWITLTAGNYEAGSELPMRLGYLALGDSYSSGEGDVGKNDAGDSFYTDDSKKECHISTRSYPFLLSVAWGFETDRMASVACSGALVTRDYSPALDAYNGQRDGLSKLVGSDRQGAIDGALAAFKPGLVPQLEFVKSHKPLVVTVTGGGNDVGFAKIAETCLKSIGDCSYTKGNDLYQFLNDAINSQYESIKELIRSIKSASPGVKVFYVGYPSFITESQGSCILDSGIMSNTERAMINGAVTRLNNVIRQATIAEGAMYVDVEDALVGGRMCEGGDYMTGLSDVSLGELFNKSSELFHPNAEGHQMLYEKIESQVSNPYKDYSVSQADVVTIEPGVETYRARIIQNEDVDGGKELVINLVPGDSLGASNIHVTVFSSKVDLGVYGSNLDGSANFTVTVPANLESGIHLLLLNITGSDGQPRRLYQYIRVTNSATHGDQTDGSTVDETGPVDTDAPSGSSTVEPEIGDVDVPANSGEGQGDSENRSDTEETDSKVVVDTTTTKADHKKDDEVKDGGDLGALGTVDSDGTVHEAPLSNAVYLTDVPAEEVKSEVLGASSEIERDSYPNASPLILGAVNSYAGVDYWKLLGAGILFINIIGWMVVYARKVKRQEQQK